jgi:hypothetical protein
MPTVFDEPVLHPLYQRREFVRLPTSKPPHHPASLARQQQLTREERTEEPQEK